MFTFLRNYRATPHSTTNLSPAESLLNRKMRTKLPQMKEKKKKLTYIFSKDRQAKEKMKVYADTRNNAKESYIKEGDTVLVKTPKENKLLTPFSSKPYIVKERHGSQITAERGGKTIVRNLSHYKKIKVDPDTLKDQEEGKDELEEIQIPNTPTIIEPDKDPLPYVRNRPTRAAKPPEYLKDYVLA